MTEETDNLEEVEPVAIAPRAWWARALRYAWVVALAGAMTALYHEWAHLDLTELNRSIGGSVRALIGPMRESNSRAGRTEVHDHLLGRRDNRIKIIYVSPARTALMSSFIAAAFSNTAGGALFGGAPARLMSGYTPGQVAKLTGFVSVATWAGHAMISGVLLLIAPPETSLLTVNAERGIGALLIAGCLLVILLGTVIKSWRGKLPSLKLSAVTLALSALDWFFAGLVLWALVPGGLSINPLSFVAVVSVASITGAEVVTSGSSGMMMPFPAGPGAGALASVVPGVAA